MVVLCKQYYQFLLFQSTMHQLYHFPLVFVITICRLFECCCSFVGCGVIVVTWKFISYINIRTYQDWTKTDNFVQVIIIHIKLQWGALIPYPLSWSMLVWLGSTILELSWNIELGGGGRFFRPKNHILSRFLSKIAIAVRCYFVSKRVMRLFWMPIVISYTTLHNSETSTVTSFFISLLSFPLL